MGLISLLTTTAKSPLHANPISHTEQTGRNSRGVTLNEGVWDVPEAADAVQDMPHLTGLAKAAPTPPRAEEGPWFTTQKDNVQKTFWFPYCIRKPGACPSNAARPLSRPVPFDELSQRPCSAVHTGAGSDEALPWGYVPSGWHLGGDREHAAKGFKGKHHKTYTLPSSSLH